MRSLKDIVEIPPEPPAHRAGHSESATNLPRRAGRIHDAFLAESGVGPGLEKLGPAGLGLLFELYDRIVFRGRLRRELGSARLSFRVSGRMTRSAGKTTIRRLRGPRGAVIEDFEIAISSVLLLDTFHGVDRTITVAGLPCHDRLEALQRVFEHELVHLVELLVWKTSSCSRARFQTLALELFGHRSHTHRLITPREQAWKRFGVRLGDRVAFCLNGERVVGFVNRITKRATVLVENDAGRRYTDGKRYSCFYVPLPLLETDPGGHGRGRAVAG